MMFGGEPQSPVLCSHSNPANHCPQCGTMDYASAMHGVQAGVAHEVNKGLLATSLEETRRAHKHLRVGINSAHVTNEALAELLIAKGVFTQQEYVEMVRVCANRELARYEERLHKETGAKVKLR